MDATHEWTSILRRAERNPCSMQIFSRQIRTDATHSTWNVAAKCQHILLSLTDDAVFDTSDTMNVSLFLTGKAKTRTGTFVPTISFFNLLEMHGMKAFLGIQGCNFICILVPGLNGALVNRPASRFFFGWFWCSWQFGRQLWLPLGMGPKFEGPKLSSFVFALTRHQSRAVAEFFVFGAWTFALRVTRWAV